MKRLLLLALLFCTGAFADTTSTPLPTSAVWTLIRGGTGAVGWNFATAAACYTAAAQNAEALKSSSIYVCREDLKFTVTYTKPVNPFPNGETQTVQCVAPTVGSWTQTRTYTFVGGKWVAGAWSPTTPPTGACTTPTAATVTTWVRVAGEGEPANVSGKVRFGWGMDWTTGQKAGTFVCNADAFPGAPKDYYNGTRSCQEWRTAPAVTQGTTAPVINTALMPTRAIGYSTARVGPGGNIAADPVQDTGAFREPCDFSHMNFDDPIVYPNQPNKSHLHVFYGQTKTDAVSTPDSMMKAGNSTCSGGTLNRTGYWTPAVVDMKTGAPVTPANQLFYYKGGYRGIPMSTIKPFPTGLRMIAGSSSNDTPIKSENTVRFWCEGTSVPNPGGIPQCPVGSQLSIMVIFPQCWDGVNLDSPDHKSHMAYANAPTGCPSTHPVPLTEISLIQHYMIETAPYNWRLSSDNYVGASGYSMHADWFNGWDTAILETWTKGCINTSKDCHANNLGDGRALY